MSRRSVTVIVARWSATHPWRAIGLWVALVAAAVALMSSVPTQQADDADLRIGESGIAATMLDDAGLTASPTESVLITAPRGTLDVAGARTVADRVTEQAKDVKGVADVGPATTSKD
jgi:RND superfamily putative drug exporter